MSKKQPLGNFVQVLSTKRKLLIQITILLGVITVFAKLYPFNGVGEWTGIGKDSNKSVTTEREINPKTKEVTKITEKETENFQSPKSFWDFLGLAGTIAIPFVLLYFERTQQRRSLQQAETEKEISLQKAETEKEISLQKAETEKKIADNNLREQALEAYFDRMSELLIDRQLKVLIGKKLEESDPEYPVLDAALNIVRVRTLSVLRRLDQDGERKGNVIRFLIDSELLSNLDLNSADLSHANFSRANLSDTSLLGANLSDANLSDANVSHAKLRSANLTNANLTKADLSHAKLSGANLSGANLSGADLTITSLINANFSRANLSDATLLGANLSDANVSHANVSHADLGDANVMNADLTKADLSNARFITVEQIKAAKNWEEAKYDPEFRALLGLTPEAPTTAS